MDISAYLKEDVGRGDVTSELTLPDKDGVARIICEEDCVVSGLEEAEKVFALMGADATSLAKDGDRIGGGARVMSVSGPLKGLLTAERTALNIIMQMSGVATLTAEAVRLADGKAVIAATRKTTPGFGDLQKKAVVAGGGDPHRAALDSMIMIKDNHIKACGSVRNAMEKVSGAPFSVKIEVEVSCVDDAVTAAEMGADIIMADHMDPGSTGELRDTVKRINPKILVEASGNMTLDKIPLYRDKADIISLGSLTHSAPAVHFSMDVD